MRNLTLLCLAGVVVAGLIGIVWHVRWSTSPAASTPPTNSASAGAMLCPVHSGDDEHCARTAQEGMRRPRLTEAQTTEAMPAWRQLGVELMTFGELCVTCPGPRERRRPTEADPEQLVAMLEAKGHTGTTARIAHPTDLAPEGTLLYAVPVTEHACAIGHISDLPGGGGGSTLLSKLADGRCLES